MKRYIYAMSGSRKDVGAEIEQGTRELIKHLIKLRLYPESESVNHWRIEVAEKLHRVSKLRISNKYPSVQFILDNSLRVHKNRIQRYITIVRCDYGDPQIDYDNKRLHRDIEMYFYWLAIKLSKYGEAAYPSIYRKLEDMGF